MFNWLGGLAPGRRPAITAATWQLVRRIDELAATAGVSRSTLEHRFRAAVGRSIHEEHVRLRLAGTRKLIVETDLPLKAVAMRAGFPSLQYMTTFVRRHAGVTPARLRTIERTR